MKSFIKPFPLKNLSPYAFIQTLLGTSQQPHEVKLNTYFQLNNSRGRRQLADAVKRKKAMFSDENGNEMETQ